jgi:hypothetical protein
VNFFSQLWLDEAMGLEQFDEAAGSECPDEAAGSQHPDEAAGSDHPGDAAGSEHLDEAAGSECPDEAAGSQHPDEAAGSDHPGDAAGSEHRDEAAGSECPDEAAGSDHPGDAAGSEHLDEAAGSECPDEAAGSDHPGDAAGSDHPGDAAGSEHLDEAAGSECPDEAAGSDHPGDAAGSEHLDEAAGSSGATSETIVMSPVNEEALRRFMALSASRELTHGGHSFAELCQAQLDRAVKMPGRPGLWTADAFGPARKPGELGLEAGLEVRHGSAHPRIAGQQVGELNGISVFAFPKIIRLLVRASAPCRVIDIVNSHFVMAEQLATRVQVPVPCIGEVVQHREELFGALGPRLNLGRDELKKLLLSLMYGAKLSYPDDFLKALCAEVHMLATAVAELHPARIAKLKETGRDARGGWWGSGGRESGAGVSPRTPSPPSLSSPGARGSKKCGF